MKRGRLVPARPGRSDCRRAKGGRSGAVGTVTARTTEREKGCIESVPHSVTPQAGCVYSRQCEQTGAFCDSRIVQAKEMAMLKNVLLIVAALLLATACYGQEGFPPQDPPAGIITPDHTVVEDDGDTPGITLFFMGIAEDELQSNIRMDKVAYVLGETGVIQFDVNQTAYIYVWTVCPTANRIVQLFPSANDPANHFAAGSHTIPTPGRTYRLQAGPPEGWKWMQIMALSHPLAGVGPHTPIPFPALDLSPMVWSQQFIAWLSQELPAGTQQAFNFTSYRIVGTPVVQQGTLRVTSSPAGAQVFIDGIPRGVTAQWQPFEIYLAPGTYNTTVRLAGFPDHHRTVDIVPGGVQEFHADLMDHVDPSGHGTLRILSHPPALDVYVGGTYRGATPLSLSLPVGVHSVQLRSGALPVWSRNVVVLPLITQTITVTTSGPSPCTYTINPTTASLPAAGGSFPASVSAAAGCAWTASSPCPWVSLDPTSGSGSETVTVNVSANPGSPRTCTLTVAGNSLAVSQSGGLVPMCLYSISPTGHGFPTAGGSVSVAVNTATGCTWTATSPCAWISVHPSSGTGPGTVVVTAAPYPLAMGQRTCTLTIAGREFSASQGTPIVLPCLPTSYSISPTSASFSRYGGSVSVNVSALSHCTWSATSPCEWVTLSPSNGTGSSTVTITVASWPAFGIPLTRTCTVTIAGKEFSITQSRAIPLGP